MSSCHASASANDSLNNHGSTRRGLMARAVATFHIALIFGFVCALVLSAAQPLCAQTQSVVYEFLFGTGVGPNSTLLLAGNNLYGTTAGGGRWERGVIFDVTTTGSATVLHSCNGPAYADPNGLIWGTGNYVFIGTTLGTGFHPNGTVFALGRGAKNGHPFRRIYSFNKSGGGSSPVAPMVVDSMGDMYGVTTYGGKGGGTIFQVLPHGQEKIVYGFPGRPGDGAFPASGLIIDAQGNLYGTASQGGSGTACSGGCGVVYKLAPDGTETVLYNFTGGADGADPLSSLAIDGTGNLYGTTYEGGGTGCSGAGCGTVFKVTPGGTETVLYSFAGGLDGAQPLASVILDSKGNLYGTTYHGGGSGCGGSGCGTVFKILPGGSETLLYSFTGDTDGGLPLAGLTLDGQGNLFGTASIGGFIPEGTNGFGVIFKITP